MGNKKQHPCSKYKTLPSGEIIFAEVSREKCPWFFEYTQTNLTMEKQMSRDRTTLTYVRECVEEEGMYYAFVGYSDFKEVEDEELHKLKETFLNSAKELAEYLRLDYEQV